ncbi:MAG: class A beta-lactamase [Bacteroidales bacterium]
MKRNLITLLCVLFTTYGFSQISDLEKSIDQLIEGKNLKLGFMLYDLQSGQCISINPDDRFPMQSVYKFPIAIAALDYAERNHIALTDTFTIPDQELSNTLWSPIRKKQPYGDIKMPLSEIIYQTVAWSDNNGSDFLLRLVGGADSALLYLTNNRFNDILIRNSESEMQASWQIQFANYTTPRAMISLLKAFYQKQLLRGESFDFLWQVMTDTFTGSFRKEIPSCAVIARKTGSSGQNQKGVTAALNDVGIWEVSNQKTLLYAIFITESTESPEINANIIAQIARLISLSH